MKNSLKISLLILLFLVVTFIGLSIYFIAKSVTSNNTQAVDQTKTTQEPISTTTSTILPSSTDIYTLPVKQQLVVADVLKKGTFETPRFLNLPASFKISLWASGLSTPRQIDWTAEGNLVLADKGSNTIKLLKSNSDGIAGEPIVIDSNLNQPSGVDYHNGNLYVGTADTIYLYTDLKEDGTYSSKQAVITNIPTDGHVTRTVKVGPDNKLYVTIGSSCDVCEEADQRRAAMLISNLDGTDLRVFASGLRNTVDFVFKLNPDSTFKIWGVDNGRDENGDDQPPEEVNIIEDGKNYGWPYCYGSGVNNPEYPERSGYCKTETVGNLFGLQAHSAPLGLTFLVNDDTTERVKFPLAIFKDSLFIAFHGSWNRSVPTGYKIVSLNTAVKNSKEADFISGWLLENGDVWGRPVELEFDKNGDMYITDDYANAIYKVEYIGSEKNL